MLRRLRKCRSIPPTIPGTPATYQVVSLCTMKSCTAKSSRCDMLEDVRRRQWRMPRRIAYRLKEDESHHPFPLIHDVWLGTVMFVSCRNVGSPSQQPYHLVSPSIAKCSGFPMGNRNRLHVLFVANWMFPCGWSVNSSVYQFVMVIYWTHVNLMFGAFFGGGKNSS
jgi:hypothetical protein